MYCLDQQSANGPTEAAAPDRPLRLLTSHPLLAAGGADLCRLLQKRYPITHLERDAELARAGDPVQTVDFLLGGDLRVFQQATDDRELLIRLVSAPAVIGDAEALQGARHARNVETLEPCCLLRLPVEDYRALLRSQSSMMQAELTHLASLCSLGAFSERAVLGSLEQRLANVLLAYADRYPRVLEDGATEITCPLSLDVLARSVGGVWRSVGHVMARMRKQGLISRRGGLRVLEKPEELARIAAPLRGGLSYHVGIDLSPPCRGKRPSAEVAVADPHWTTYRAATLVEDEIIVGSLLPVDLLVSDAGVCPRHARVFRSGTGRYWVQDLDSSLGTTLNDEPVRMAVLHDGDRIKVGETELLFRLKVEDQAHAA